MTNSAYAFTITPALVACAWRDIIFGFMELADRNAAFEVYRELLTVNADEPAVQERCRRAAAEVAEAHDWLDGCLLRHRQAIRQTQQDAVQSAAQPAGAAA